jgi:L-malate glycosyltransferase
LNFLKRHSNWEIFNGLLKQKMESNNNLKVLMVTRTSHITEIEMMCRLREQGVQVEAITESACPYIGHLKNAGVPHESLDLTSRIDFKAIKHLRNRIVKEGFHVAHGFSNRPISNLVWASYGLPHALVIYRGAIGHVRRWDPDCWLKWLNPRVDRISCVSDAVRKDLDRFRRSSGKADNYLQGP